MDDVVISSCRRRDLLRAHRGSPKHGFKQPERSFNQSLVFCESFDGYSRPFSLFCIWSVLSRFLHPDSNSTFTITFLFSLCAPFFFFPTTPYPQPLGKTCRGGGREAPPRPAPPRTAHPALRSRDRGVWGWSPGQCVLGVHGTCPSTGRCTLGGRYLERRRVHRRQRRLAPVGRDPPVFNVLCTSFRDSRSPPRNGLRSGHRKTVAPRRYVEPGEHGRHRAAVKELRPHS